MGSRPGPGNSKGSFSSCQETAKGFSSKNALLFQIITLEVLVGSVSYRPSASPSCEASSQAKNIAYSGHSIIIIIIICDFLGNKFKVSGLNPEVN